VRDWVRRWKWFCLAVVVLFASAGPTGTLAVSAYQRLGAASVGLIVLSVVLALLAGFLLAPILRNRERRSPMYLLGILFLGLGYLFFLTRMTPYPIEKIHFAVYGLLAYLSYSAMEQKGTGNLFIRSFCLVSLVGFLDEVYQGLLPNRRYDEQDILMNMMSVFLGLILTLLLKRARPGSVFSDILHKGNFPYLLLWLPAVALFLYLHIMPESMRLIPGTWHRMGFCRSAEWLRLEPDGTLLWWDEEGNRAWGDYRITGNRLEGIYFHGRAMDAQNGSECGWQAGVVITVQVEVNADRLIFVPSPDRFWTRQAPANSNGQDAFLSSLPAIARVGAYTAPQHPIQPAGKTHADEPTRKENPQPL